MTGIDNLVAAYVRLLVYQYQLPKAQAMAAAFARQCLGDGIAADVRDAYEVATAVGPQLDVLGKYIGLPRTIGSATPLPWFGFVRATGVGSNTNGFIRTTNSDNREVVFYRAGYLGSRNTALTDTAYAFMLALKIILNSSDGTLASIDRYIQALLPDTVTVIDNKDMTLTYTIVGNPPVDPAVLAAYLPKPMGVGINVQTSDFIITDGGDSIVTDGGDHLVTTAV